MWWWWVMCLGEEFIGEAAVDGGDVVEEDVGEFAWSDVTPTHTHSNLPSPLLSTLASILALLPPLLFHLF